MRYAWTAAGFFALALGIIGAVLPIMPTAPFVIVAAFFFGRGSPRLRARLHAHPLFGPPIRDWEERGAISKRAKWIACTAMAAGLVFSWLAGLPGAILAGQAAVMTAAAVFMLTRPS